MGIGNNIKEQRTKLGLTQKNLADKLNVTAQAISRWENEDVEPSIDTLKQMSSLFNISLDEFLNNDFTVKSEISNSEVVASETQEETFNSELVATEMQTEDLNIEEVVGETQIGRPNSESSTVERQTENINSEDSTQKDQGKGPIKIATGTCRNCGKEFPITQLKTKRARVGRRTTHQGPYCPSCYNAIQEAHRRHLEHESSEHAKKVKIRRILGYVIGFVAFAILFGISIALAVNSGDNTWMAFGAVAGVCAYFIIACALFGENLVTNCFTSIAGLGIKFPGIIFTLDIDGIIFFILIKVLFGIITIIASIFLFIIACIISGAIAVVYYPYILVISYKHPEDIDLF